MPRRASLAHAYPVAVPAHVESGHGWALDEVPVEQEQQYRSEEREQQPAPVAEEELRDQSADECAGDSEKRRHRDRHGVRPRQRPPRQGPDDEPTSEDNDQERDQTHHSDGTSLRRAAVAESRFASFVQATGSLRFLTRFLDRAALVFATDRAGSCRRKLARQTRKRNSQTRKRNSGAAPARRIRPQSAGAEDAERRVARERLARPRPFQPRELWAVATRRHLRPATGRARDLPFVISMSSFNLKPPLFNG